MAIRLVEDHDETGAMALGDRPFIPSPLYERLAERDPRELLKSLTPGERLSLGYYLAARGRHEGLKEG